MSSPKIGRYEIERRLGRGGIAVVYLAFDPHVKRQVAIKVMSTQLITDPHFRDRFQREAQVIATLENPYIVQVYDFGEHDEQPYIVMSYMPGGSLRGRLAQGPLDLLEVIKIINRIVQALDEAHTQHIIHCDLKPSNILFNTKGEAFFSDFGIARMAGISATQTSSGIMGTPAYMSPEQASGAKDLDSRSDVYSLGVVLFQALSGQLPYEADTPVALALKHMIEPVPHILQLRPDLPAGCETVIRRALAKDRNERFSTASELAAALTAAAQSKTVSLKPELEENITRKVGELPELKAGPSHLSSPGSSLPLPSKVKARRQRWWSLLAVVLLLLLVVGIRASGFMESMRQPITPSSLPSPTNTAVVLVVTATPKPIPTSRPRPTNTQGTGMVAATSTLSSTVSIVVPSSTPTPTVASVTAWKIAFVSDRDGDNEIYTINPDGSDLVKWTDNSPTFDGDPACAPDGRYIAFQTDQNGRFEAYMLELESKTARRLRNDAFPGFETDWSPDGQYLVFQSVHDIFRMRSDGSELVGLMTHPANDADPSWSPDGQKIAFSSDRDGNFELYLMNADGSDVTRLTDSPGSDLEPAWSSDRKTIAFYSDRDGDNEIYTLALDSGKISQLTDNTAGDYVPDWSPDGQWLVFETHRDGNPELYIMRADGTDVTRITNHLANDWGPCWLMK